jgi:hypothetical protein
VTGLYDLLGYRVAVTVADPLDSACRSVLANFAIDAPGGEAAAQSYSVIRADDRWHVEAGGLRMHSVADERAAIATLEWQLVSDALKHRPDLFHVHGAALAPPELDGAVVLAGAAGVGKTTLARALMDRGFLPFGDDVTLVDPLSLELQPFPRAFHLRTPGGDTPDSPRGSLTYFQPLHWARSPLPVKLILFLSRGAEGEARAVLVGPAEAASSLLRHSGSLVAAPAHALSVAVRVIAQAPCYRFELGSPEASAALVEALCAGWRSRPREATASRT